MHISTHARPATHAPSLACMAHAHTNMHVRMRTRKHAHRRLHARTQQHMPTHPPWQARTRTHIPRRARGRAAKEWTAAAASGRARCAHGPHHVSRHEWQKVGWLLLELRLQAPQAQADRSHLLPGAGRQARQALWLRRKDAPQTPQGGGRRPQQVLQCHTAALPAPPPRTLTALVNVPPSSSPPLANTVRARSCTDGPVPVLLLTARVHAPLLLEGQRQGQEAAAAVQQQRAQLQVL